MWINFTSKKDDWNAFEKNNVAIVLNVLHAKKGKKCFPLLFQKMIQFIKTNLLF